MSDFTDKTHITVKAGRGGDGAVAFHREKYIANGGPDGGDGGRGGNIVFTVDNNMSTLMDFRYKQKFTAGAGANGSGKRCNGKDGETVYIKVPRGTVIKDTASGAVMHDMSTGEDWICARGGRGGWGNCHFATPTRQVPRFAKPGLPGEEHELTLELKLIADVGLIGFPNVGKSTLLSVVSKAHPKIANYHFTTLFPNLGVVYVGEGESFVMADIPGLIEGAADGLGLGHDFLRHVDRCRLLVHVVDISGSEGRDPIEDYKTIMGELESYSPELAGREQIIVGNKADLLNEENIEAAEAFRKFATEQGYDYIELSAAAHTGVKQLIDKCAEKLSALPPIPAFEADYVAPEPETGTAEDLVITNEDDMWTVEGPWLQRIVASVNFSDYESRMYFDRVLRESGVFARMEEMGVKDGDTVSIYDLMFEYKD